MLLLKKAAEKKATIMKKLIFALAMLFAFACEDNRRSEREDDLDDNTEIVEPDRTESDTATVNDMDRDVASDRRDRDESGTESREQSDTSSTWDKDRDRYDSDADSIR